MIQAKSPLGRIPSESRNFATIFKHHNFRGKTDCTSVPKLNNPVNIQFKYSTVVIENIFDFIIGGKYHFLQELENERRALG